VTHSTAPRSLAALGGATFVLLGVLGLVSRGHLFGVFEVSVLLDAVHLILGAAGIAAATTSSTAQSFLRLAGIASLSLWLLGVLAAGHWLALDTADNWLHFVLAVALIGAAPLAGREAAPA
jgi:Domain of unknown function (DUF4383)